LRQRWRGDAYSSNNRQSGNFPCLNHRILLFDRLFGIPTGNWISWRSTLMGQLLNGPFENVEYSP
jgi:hypothetical protein